MDGTIVDASVGILKRLRIAHEHLGIEAPKEEDLINWIGPPMHESFRNNSGLTPEQAEKAVVFYRGLHTEGTVGDGARLFDGVAELLAEVERAGVPQAIASSKPEVQVVPLSQFFDIDESFVAMVGSGEDEQTRTTKADVVREALHRLEVAGADISNPVLIGDRHHDIDGGAEVGVPVIFVTWGFSRPEEAEGSIAVANTMAELRELILTD